MPIDTYSAEIGRRCERRRLSPATAAAAVILGAAVDAGIISLPDLVDLVKSCSSADELGDALTMLAASAYVLIPAPAGRVFRIVGEPEGGDTWTL